MMNINWCGSENDGIDRISSLPDDVCTHILSFLSTREAVQTCILSKRWINTWASVLDLKFDIIKEFGFPGFPIDEDMVVASATKFELLVKSVLEKREISCVNKFQLSMNFRVSWPRTQAIADCIGDVVKLEPRECLVELGSCQILNLNTDLIFTCASLTYLQLRFDINTIIMQAIEPNLVNLPCLKTLVLSGVKMSNDSFKNLLLGCPVLEELVLARFKIEILEICSNSLKKLEVYNICVGVKLHISTPNLLYLAVIALGEIVLLNMPLLVDAAIGIPDWYDQDIYVTRGPKLIHSLSNVESLHLEFDFPERKKIQQKDFSKGPVFNNLKRLELVNSSFFVSDVAPYFLHHSPKLQELTLEYDHDDQARFTKILDVETTQEENPTDALVQREFLKTVRILSCKNDNGFVDQLINKLLTHVKIIGDIIIDPNDTCQ